MKTNITIWATVLTTLLTSLTQIQAQNPSANIATWKNNASGTYTLVHDDYGDAGVDGIWQYADTIAYNRGIKFTFGAITQSCETPRNINGYSSPYAYATNVMMAQHGHEIMNHSHTHDCAVGNAGWDPCNLPAGQSWGEDNQSANFNTQLVVSHNSIINNTGFTPKYFIFPYDRFSNAANVKLKELNYLGSRTGWTSPLGEFYATNGYDGNDNSNFAPDGDGFFRTAVSVFDDSNSQLSESGQANFLRSELDAAIASGQWINRELHNVGSSGWGHVAIGAYRTHLDYVKTLMDNGSLWVGTVSEVLTYQLQKLKYSPNVNYNAPASEITVSWNSINPQYNVSVGPLLDGLTVKSPITLVVDLDGLTGVWQVTQNGQTLQSTQNSGSLYIDVYPHQGDVIISQNVSGNTAPYVQSAIADQNLQENFTSYQIDLTSVFEDAQTSDGNLIYTVSGNSNVVINIVNGVATISSTTNWTGNETVTFEVEDELGLKVSDEVIFVVTGAGNQSAYNGPHILPGRLQAEDFDTGDADEAYFEINNSWDPDPNTNPYRSNHPVDIGEITTGEYGIGYTVTGEWLEYTVSVTKTGNYDFSFRTAQEDDGWNAEGQLRVLLSGNEVIPSVTSTFTSSWGSYTNISSTNVYLTEGNHVLRVEWTVGNVNLDYIDVTLSNEAPYIDNALSNYDLEQNFTAFDIDLKNVFEDAETSDLNLNYGATGNSNIQVNITNGVANIAVTQGWTGVEVITFTAADEGGLSTDHIVTFEVKLPTSSSVAGEESVFSLYPNPTNGRVFVFGKVNSLQVFDGKGQLLIQTGKSEIDLSNYANGLYFVRINNEGKMHRVLKTQ